MKEKKPLEFEVEFVFEGSRSEIMRESALKANSPSSTPIRDKGLTHAYGSRMLFLCNWVFK